MPFDLDKITRENIKTLKPYSSARDEFSGEASVFLDANENSLGSPLLKWYNRYPDPLQKKLKDKLSQIKNVSPDQIFIGNGSDECIDLLIRCFCEPKEDNIITLPPTYGMYKVSADINYVEVKEVALQPNFQLDLEAIENAIDANTKMIFICSPNNPTGNSISHDDVEMILNNYDGLVVVDEAYINFSRQQSWLASLADYPNLIVMQTLSKAWGLAGLRVGLAFASQAIIDVMNRVKPPYNVGTHTQELALEALDHLDDVNTMIKEIVEQRDVLADELSALNFVETIYPSDANFLLVKMKQATAVYDFLRSRGIIVRNRSSVILCNDSLRITVGSAAENKTLVQALKTYND